jgi:hypothetical protein
MASLYPCYCYVHIQVKASQWRQGDFIEAGSVDLEMESCPLPSASKPAVAAPHTATAPSASSTSSTAAASAAAAAAATSPLLPLRIRIRECLEKKNIDHVEQFPFIRSLLRRTATATATAGASQAGTGDDGKYVDVQQFSDFLKELGVELASDEKEKFWAFIDEKDEGKVEVGDLVSILLKVD